MQKKALKRKTGFQQGLKHGQSFEKQVETYLKRQGFMVSKLNIESLSRDHVGFAQKKLSITHICP